MKRWHWGVVTGATAAVVVFVTAVGGVHLMPDAKDNAEFFDGFWPQLVATAGGVGVALWHDRYLLRRSDERRAEQAHDDLVRGVELALQTLEHNKRLLENVVAVRRSGSPDPPVTVFDTSSWRFIAPELAPLRSIRRETNEFYAMLRHVGVLIDALQRLLMGEVTRHRPGHVLAIRDDVDARVDAGTAAAAALVRRLRAIARFLANESDDAELEDDDRKDLPATKVGRQRRALESRSAATGKAVE